MTSAVSLFQLDELVPKVLSELSKAPLIGSPVAGLIRVSSFLHELRDDSSTSDSRLL
ncbi:hypothetical protein [Legionella sp. PC997]|uniref:hypothetical protein n=1 Tax=Legionella sp. PC997 TaxID=2755562 RepID=UPI0015FB2FA0|nr:hypothetical protein [Legionella sp. PC997]